MTFGISEESLFHGSVDPVKYLTKDDKKLTFICLSIDNSHHILVLAVVSAYLLSGNGCTERVGQVLINNSPHFMAFKKKNLELKSLNTSRYRIIPMLLGICFALF